MPGEGLGAGLYNVTIEREGQAAVASILLGFGLATHKSRPAQPACKAWPHLLDLPVCPSLICLACRYGIGFASGLLNGLLVGAGIPYQRVHGELDWAGRASCAVDLALVS